MSYRRVFPRDLFNEANLLKGLARLSLHLLDWPGRLGEVSMPDCSERVTIHRRDADGHIYVAELPITIRDRAYMMTRPLNSREAWPLYLEDWYDPDFEPIRIFAEDNDTDFSREFIAFCKGDQP